MKSSIDGASCQQNPKNHKFHSITEKLHRMSQQAVKHSSIARSAKIRNLDHGINGLSSIFVFTVSPTPSTRQNSTRESRTANLFIVCCYKNKAYTGDGVRQLRPISHQNVSPPTYCAIFFPPLYAKKTQRNENV